jgi:ribose transport system permease protein
MNVGAVDTMTLRRTGRLARVVLVQYPMVILLVLVSVVFVSIEPGFATRFNVINVLKQSSYLIMLSMAQMTVLITRGFDLSVGNVISMISVASSLIMVGLLTNHSTSIGAAILVGCLAGLGIGVTVGAINGLVVAFLGVSPFVATLGMMGIALGIATTISGGFPVFDVPEQLMDVLSRASVIMVPVPIVVCVCVGAALYFVLNYITFGRSLYLIGSNPRAAYLAGIPVRRHTTMAYALCSVIVAIVALMLTARTGSGEPSLGGGLMLQSLMAAVIGGVSLRGGEGRVFYCVGGGLFVTVLSNGMNLVRVNSYIQMMVLGAVLIGAVIMDRVRAQMR